MDILQYIKMHMITYIGTGIMEPMVDEYLATEVILDDPQKFVNEITKSNYYVSLIRWWHRIPVNTSSSIGYGGPLDPRDPDNFYFAETHIEESFEKSTSYSQYIHYLSKIRDQYKNYDIYPAFDICSK